jgi:hypothetical protein
VSQGRLGPSGFSAFKLRRVAAKDDDDVISDESGLEFVEETTDEEETDEVEPDVEDLDDDVIDEPDVDVDDDDAVVEEEAEEDEDDDDTEPVAKRTKKRAEEDDDEDDDLLSPDDVEADLDRILKDRMVTVDEDEDEDEVEPEDRGEGGDRLQPKRPDEQLCPSCFLLVRASAPACPVGDDACPIFS